MATYALDIFADYNQFFIKDELSNLDLSESWTEESLKNMAVIEDGVLAVSTVRNMDVPVEVEITDSEPSINLHEYDHVVRTSIAIDSGKIVIAGASDYLPDSKRIAVQEEHYGVLVLFNNLDSVSEDGLDGEDQYKLVLWPEKSPVQFEVVKRYS